MLVQPLGPGREKSRALTQVNTVRCEQILSAWQVSAMPQLNSGRLSLLTPFNQFASGPRRRTNRVCYAKKEFSIRHASSRLPITATSTLHWRATFRIRRNSSVHDCRVTRTHRECRLLTRYDAGPRSAPGPRRALLKTGSPGNSSHSCLRCSCCHHRNPHPDRGDRRHTSARLGTMRCNHRH